MPHVMKSILQNRALRYLQLSLSFITINIDHHAMTNANDNLTNQEFGQRYSQSSSSLFHLCPYQELAHLFQNLQDKTYLEIIWFD